LIITCVRLGPVLGDLGGVCWGLGLTHGLPPINLDATKTAQLAGGFGCPMGSFPFSYLGIPTGISNSKPKNRDFLPLLEKIEKMLNMFGVDFQ
jgi:hypothetical protein